MQLMYFLVTYYNRFLLLVLFLNKHRIRLVIFFPINWEYQWARCIISLKSFALQPWICQRPYKNVKTAYHGSLALHLLHKIMLCLKYTHISIYKICRSLQAIESGWSEKVLLNKVLLKVSFHLPYVVRKLLTYIGSTY